MEIVLEHLLVLLGSLSRIPKEKIVRIQQFAAPELAREIIDVDVKERTREGGALRKTLLEGLSAACCLP